MEPVFSFGEWVRRRRRALELTQAELGECVGLATVSIHKIEADERRPSHTTATRLAAALHIPPAEQELFLRAARAALPVDQLKKPVNDDILAVSTFQHTRAAPRARLPIPPNPLLGRECELGELQQLLARPEVRLITITGPGGVGKTRLALALAEALERSTSASVCFVPLATISDPTMVVTTILHRLGVPLNGEASLSSLIAYLQTHDTILVVDNFEHLMEAAIQIAALLSAAATCRIIATSRAPLHLQGEHEYLLQPLAFPTASRRRTAGDWGADGEASADIVLQTLDYPAIRLFFDRACAIQHDLALTSANIAAVGEICRYLDGLPLAIELAAARVRTLPPPALRAQFTRGEGSLLTLLTGGPRDLPEHQQTLLKTLEWSYRLLSPELQQLFRRLAIFTGGWTMEAAGVVVAEPDRDISDGIDALLIHNLIRVATGTHDCLRYEMLATIHAFAHSLLASTNEYERLRRRHAGYYAELVDYSNQAHRGRLVVGDWSDRLEAEISNIRAALDWSAGPAGDAALAVRLVGRLGYWCLMQGYHTEERAWLERTLLARRPDELPNADTALLLYWAGNYGLIMLDIPAARRRFDESRAMYQAIGDADGVAYLDFALGRLGRETGDYAQAESSIRQALAYYRTVHDWRRIAFALESLADIALDHGRTAQAEPLLWEAYELFQSYNDAVGMNEVLCNLSRAASIDHTYSRAADYLEQALALARQQHVVAKIESATIQLGRVAANAGLYDKAMAVLERAMALAHESHDPFSLAVVYTEIGRVSRMAGNLTRAAASIVDALDHLRKAPAAYTLVACLEELARIAAESRQPVPAARLFGEAAALRTNSGIVRPPVDQLDYERDLALACDQLDDAVFRVAWDEGAALTAAQAIDEARQLAQTISANRHALSLW